jgi:hypothetical protein
MHALRYSFLVHVLILCYEAIRSVRISVVCCVRLPCTAIASCGIAVKMTPQKCYPVLLCRNGMLQTELVVLSPNFGLIC